MIEEPALLQLGARARRLRPTPAQIAAFEGVPTGFVADAMNGTGALDHRIKPLSGLPNRILGPALTCDSGPRDVLALMAAIGEVVAGDVLVNATGPWLGCACVGDRVCGTARNAGAVGLITDGLGRDLAGMQDVGLPVFCQGLSPNSPFTKGPGSIGLPVQICGHPVATGDMIVADEDGVVVVPFAQIDAVIAQLETIKRLEAERDAKVADGMLMTDAVIALRASGDFQEV